MPELENSRGNRWLTAITFEKSDYNKIMKELDEVNVESRPLWKPMHMQKLFENSKSILNGVTLIFSGLTNLFLMTSFLINSLAT